MDLEDLTIAVPDRLFAAAESLHVQGTYDVGKLQAGPDTYTFEQPVAWEADITNTGEALLVAGVAKGRAKVACSRCLEDAFYDLEGNVEGYFLIPGEDGQLPDEDDEQDFEVLGSDQIIDFEPLICSALLLEVPVLPLCKDDCKGLCFTCGANLNEGPCGCQSQEDAVDEMNPFAVLKNLKFD